MYTHNGAVTLLVSFIVMTILISVSLIVWRSSSRLFDIAQEKQQYELQLRLTEGALNVGIEKMRNMLAIHYRKQRGAKTKKPFVFQQQKLPLGQWPPPGVMRKHQGYYAMLTVSPGKEHSARIIAQLHKNNRVYCTLSSVIDQEGVAHDWTIHALE